MDKIKRIFVTGIYGTGKSTLCRNLAAQYQVEHVIASQLIYSYLQKQPPIDKRISDIERNQYILLEALKEYSSSSLFQILEGHSCLLNQVNEVEYVPEKVFDKLCLSGILLLTSNIPMVAKILQDRDQVKYNVRTLEKLQYAETEYVRYLSKKAEIPLLEIDCETIEDVLNLNNIEKISCVFQLKPRTE